MKSNLTLQKSPVPVVSDSDVDFKPGDSVVFSGRAGVIAGYTVASDSDLDSETTTENVVHRGEKLFDVNLSDGSVRRQVKSKNLRYLTPPSVSSGTVIDFSIGDSVLCSNRVGKFEWRGEIIGYSVVSDTDSDSETTPENAAHKGDKLFDIKLSDGSERRHVKAKNLRLVLHAFKPALSSVKLEPPVPLLSASTIPAAAPTAAPLEQAPFRDVFDSLDARLTLYQRELTQRVAAGSSGILLEHEFLHQRDEATMEQEALFGDSGNIGILTSLLSKCAGYAGSVEEAAGHLAVVASVGTSSTQVYSKAGAIGAFLTGSTAMHEHPALAGEVLAHIVRAMRGKYIEAPIVLVNSIGFLVKSSVNVVGATDVALLAAVNDEKRDKARSEGDSKALAKEEAVVSAALGVLRELARVSAELGLRKPCIVQSREKPELKGDWMDVQCHRFGEQYPQGVYVVDFGGGGPDLYFFKRGEGLINIDKDRSLRLGQPLFVGEMMRGEYESSEAFQRTVSFLREKICAHAAARGVSLVVCKVYQTGMARQQHYVDNIEAVSEMTVFDGQMMEYQRNVGLGNVDSLPESVGVDMGVKMLEMPIYSVDDSVGGGGNGDDVDDDGDDNHDGDDDGGGGGKAGGESGKSESERARGNFPYLPSEIGVFPALYQAPALALNTTPQMPTWAPGSVPSPPSTYPAMDQFIVPFPAIDDVPFPALEGVCDALYVAGDLNNADDETSDFTAGAGAIASCDRDAFDVCSAATTSVSLLNVEDDLTIGDEAGLVFNRVADAACNFVTVFGPAREGKSFLMNCLAGDREAKLFAVSHSAVPCTKGIMASTKWLQVEEFAVANRNLGEAAEPSDVSQDSSSAKLSQANDGDSDGDGAAISSPNSLSASSISPSESSGLPGGMISLQSSSAPAAASPSPGTPGKISSPCASSTGISSPSPSLGPIAAAPAVSSPGTPARRRGGGRIFSPMIPPGTRVGFLDVEGFGDQGDEYDRKLACVALLISKCVIFNWKAGLQKNAILEKLGVMAKAASMLKLSDTGTDDASGRMPFGHLHVVLRDCHLEDEEELQNLRQLLFDEEAGSSSAISNRNSIRRLIEANFESHCVWAFPSAIADGQKAQSLLPACSRPEFKDQLGKMRAVLVEQLQQPVLASLGDVLKGRQCVPLLERVIGCINRDEDVSPRGIFEQLLIHEFHQLQSDFDSDIETALSTILQGIVTSSREFSLDRSASPLEAKLQSIQRDYVRKQQDWVDKVGPMLSEKILTTEYKDAAILQRILGHDTLSAAMQRFEEESIPIFCHNLSSMLSQLKANFEHKARKTNVEHKENVAKSESLAFEPPSQQLDDELEKVRAGYAAARQAWVNAAGSKVCEAIRKSCPGAETIDDDTGWTFVMCEKRIFEASIIPILWRRASQKMDALRSAFMDEVKAARARLVQEVVLSEAVSYEPFFQKLTTTLGEIQNSYLKDLQSLEHEIGPRVLQALYEDDVEAMKENDRAVITDAMAAYEAETVRVLSERALQALSDMRAEFDARMKDAKDVKASQLERDRGLSREGQYESMADDLSGALKQIHHEFTETNEVLLMKLGPKVLETLTKENSTVMTEDLSNVVQAIELEFEALSIPVLVERAQRAVEGLREGFIDEISALKADHLTRAGSSDAFCYEIAIDMLNTELETNQRAYNAKRADLQNLVGPRVWAELRGEDTSGDPMEADISRLFAIVKSGFELECVAKFLEKVTPLLVDVSSEFVEAVEATIARHIAAVQNSEEYSFDPASSRLSEELEGMRQKYNANIQSILEAAGDRVSKALNEDTPSEGIVKDDGSGAVARSMMDFEAAVVPVLIGRAVEELSKAQKQFELDIKSAREGHVRAAARSEDYVFESANQQLSHELEGIRGHYIQEKQQIFQLAGERISQALDGDNTSTSALLKYDGSDALFAAHSEFKTACVALFTPRAAAAVVLLRSDFERKIDDTKAQVLEEVEQSQTELTYEPIGQRLFSLLEEIRQDYARRQKDMRDQIGGSVGSALMAYAPDTRVRAGMEDAGSALIAATVKDFDSIVVPQLCGRAANILSERRADFETQVEATKTQLLREVKTSQTVTGFEPSVSNLEAELAMLRESYVGTIQQLLDSLGDRVRVAVHSQQQDDVKTLVEDHSSLVVRQTISWFEKEAVPILSSLALERLRALQATVEGSMRAALDAEWERIKHSQEYNYEPLADELSMALAEIQKSEFAPARNGLLKDMGPKVRLHITNEDPETLGEDLSTVLEGLKSNFEAKCIPMFVKRASQSLDRLRSTFAADMAAGSAAVLVEVESREEREYAPVLARLSPRLAEIQNGFKAATQAALDAAGPKVCIGLEACIDYAAMTEDGSALLQRAMSDFQAAAAPLVARNVEAEIKRTHTRFCQRMQDEHERWTGALAVHTVKISAVIQGNTAASLESSVEVPVASHEDVNSFDAAVIQLHLRSDDLNAQYEAAVGSLVEQAGPEIAEILTSSSSDDSSSSSGTEGRCPRNLRGAIDSTEREFKQAVCVRVAQIGEELSRHKSDIEHDMRECGDRLMGKKIAETEDGEEVIAELEGEMSRLLSAFGAMQKEVQQLVGDISGEQLITTIEFCVEDLNLLRLDLRRSCEAEVVHFFSEKFRGRIQGLVGDFTAAMQTASKRILEDVAMHVDVCSFEEAMRALSQALAHFKQQFEAHKQEVIRTTGQRVRDHEMNRRELNAEVATESVVVAKAFEEACMLHVQAKLAQKMAALASFIKVKMTAAGDDILRDVGSPLHVYGNKKQVIALLKSRLEDLRDDYCEKRQKELAAAGPKATECFEKREKELAAAGPKVTECFADPTSFDLDALATQIQETFVKAFPQARSATFGSIFSSGMVCIDELQQDTDTDAAVVVKKLEFGDVETRVMAKSVGKKAGRTSDVVASAGGANASAGGASAGESGLLFATDTITHSVCVFDIESRGLLGRFGCKGSKSGHFRDPAGLVLLPLTRKIATKLAANRGAESGAQLRLVPPDIAVLPGTVKDTFELFVADYGNNRVQVIDGATGYPKRLIQHRHIDSRSLEGPFGLTLYDTLLDLHTEVEGDRSGGAPPDDRYAVGAGVVVSVDGNFVEGVISEPPARSNGDFIIELNEPLATGVTTVHAPVSRFQQCSGVKEKSLEQTVADKIGLEHPRETETAGGDEKAEHDSTPFGHFTPKRSQRASHVGAYYTAPAQSQQRGWQQQRQGQQQGRRLNESAAQRIRLRHVVREEPLWLLIVSQREGHRVDVFDALTGAWEREIGFGSDHGERRKNGFFNRPMGLALYQPQQQQLQLQLQLHRRIGVGLPPGTGTGQQPAGLPVSSLLYVADTGNNRIQVFSASSGRFVRTIGEEGSGPGQLNGPEGLALHVLDAAAARTHHSVGGAASTAAIPAVPASASAPTPTTATSMPGGAADATGGDTFGFDRAQNASTAVAAAVMLLYVADHENSRVQVFDAITGAYFCTLPESRDPASADISPAAETPTRGGSEDSTAMSANHSASVSASPSGSPNMHSNLTTPIRSLRYRSGEDPGDLPSREGSPHASPGAGLHQPDAFSPQSLSLRPSTDGKLVTVFVSDKSNMCIRTFNHRW